MIRLLGPVTLVAGDRPIDMRTPRQRVVLAALAVDIGRSVTVDALIDRVWGPAAPARARETLHAYVSRIRAALKGVAGLRLVRASGGYLLEGSPDTVDLHRFQHLVTRSAGADPRPKLDMLRQALALWSGEALAGLTGDWVTRMRNAWQWQRIDAVVAWADAELAVGSPQAVIATIAPLADENPLVEPLAAALMKALHVNGRTAEALDRYTDTRRILVRELGMEPGAELRAVQHEILRGDPSTQDGRRPGALPPVWNVPARNAAFTGRDEMLERLRDRLAESRSVVVQALHGWGGIGKTQLAIEFCHRFAADYDAVWWVDSERPDLIGEQLGGLGVALGAASPDLPVPAAVRALRVALGGRDRWLVVFDNADGPADVHLWLPQGPGHVLVTSRNQNWAGTAEPVPVDVFARTESVELFRRHLPALSEPDADRLATALGDLPLAVAQAGGFLAETGLTVDTYLGELDRHAAVVTAAGVPVGYDTSFAAAIRLAAKRLAATDEAAACLLRLCAFLAPEPIPVDLFGAAPDALPAPLDAVAATTLGLASTVGQLGRFGFARVRPDGVLLHRLVQAVLRDDLTERERRDARERVQRMLVAAQPDDVTDPTLWPRWAALLPHILAVGLDTPTDDDLCHLACATLRHLSARGDTRAAQALGDRLFQRWRQHRGPDDRFTMTAAWNLALVHRDLGHYTESRDVYEDILTRRTRMHGPDHPDTLLAATGLAMTLWEMGDYARSRQLNEDTLARRRRVLGDDDPHTLISMSNLAVDLRALGEYEQARQLHEDTLVRRRRIFGDDHPYTLMSASNLAADLREMGDCAEAARLDEDTFTRRRRVLGADHPNTLSSANDLAVDLRALGGYERARRLDEDTLARRRRVLGDDHPHTRQSAENLATDLRALEP